jgi:hypothetical protein
MRDGWVTGTEAVDLLGYLDEFAARPGVSAVDASRLARCACGGEAFTIEFFSACGVGRLTCAACGAGRFVADAAEHWDDTFAEEELFAYACPACDGEVANAALGLSLHAADPDAVRWLYLVTRCTGCGLIGILYETGVATGSAAEFLATTGTSS